MTIKFVVSDGGGIGKLADVELHFDRGPLHGLKLIGFGIWERKSGGGYSVTFPARQYSMNGERRSYALLRPIVDISANHALRDLIIEAWQEHVKLMGETV